MPFHDVDMLLAGRDVEREPALVVGLARLDDRPGSGPCRAVAADPGSGARAGRSRGRPRRRASGRPSMTVRSAGVSAPARTRTPSTARAVASGPAGHLHTAGGCRRPGSRPPRANRPCSSLMASPQPPRIARDAR